MIFLDEDELEAWEHQKLGIPEDEEDETADAEGEAAEGTAGTYT